MTIESMSVEDLNSRLTSGSNIQVIDVRQEEDFERSHIQNSINISINDLSRQLDKIDWETDIVCVCEEGLGSKQVARMLVAYEKYNSDKMTIYNLEDGLRNCDCSEKS